MKKLLFLSFVVSFGYAQTLEELQQKLQMQNLSLQHAFDAISIKEKKIEVADSWDNPYLTVGANDLLVDDITVRDREAMQAQFVSISQNIPLGGKTAIKKSIAKKDKELAELSLKDSFLKLSSKLYMYGYRVSILDKKLALLNKYKINAKRLKHLHVKRFEIGKSSQSTILKAKILENKLFIKKRKLLTQKRKLLKKIEALTYEKVSSVESSLLMNKHLSNEFQNHPYIKLLEKKIEQTSKKLQLKKAMQTSDIKVGVGYFQRDDRTDYISVNVGMPLQITNKEKSQTDVVLLELTQAKRALKSQKFLFKTKIQSLEDTLSDTLSNYRELKETILPKQNNMYKLLEQEIFTKSISMGALFENLNERINLELEALDMMMDYFDTYAKLLYFQGDLS